MKEDNFHSRTFRCWIQSRRYFATHVQWFIRSFGVVSINNNSYFYSKTFYFHAEEVKALFFLLNRKKTQSLMRQTYSCGFFAFYKTKERKEREENVAAVAFFLSQEWWVIICVLYIHRFCFARCSILNSNWMKDEVIFAQRQYLIQWAFREERLLLVEN